MTVVVIFKDDLDNKTVKQVETPVGKKVGAPGAEIEVLDNFTKSDTNTHYIVRSSKYLKHKQTGAVWQADVIELRERGATVIEHFTSTPTAVFNYADNNGWFTLTATSTIDGTIYTKQLGNFKFTDYTDAKDFNEKHVGKKLQFTVEDRFLEVGDKPKVLGTTAEIDYPQLPYNNSTDTLSLTIYGETNINITYANSNLASNAEKVEKTAHYKITMINGRVYEGTRIFTDNTLVLNSYITDGGDIRGNIVKKVEYSLDSYKVPTFFGEVTILPSTALYEANSEL